jgi:hypothetical protein
VLIGQDLHLDVPWPLQVAFQIDGGIAEGCLRFLLSDLQSRGEFALLPHDPHAASTATGCGLDENGIAQLARDAPGLARIANGRLTPWDDREPGALHEPTRFCLVAERTERLRSGSDESDPAFFADLGQECVLGQKPVTGVEGIAAGDDRRTDDGRNMVVAPLSWCRPDTNRLVSQTHRQRFSVGLRVGDDGRDTQFPARAEDAQRDLASVGDEDLADHAAHDAMVSPPSTARTAPVMYRAPGETRKAIASATSSGVP